MARSDPLHCNTLQDRTVCFSKPSESRACLWHESQSNKHLYGCLQAEKGWPADPGVVLRTTAHHWQTRATAYARNSFLAAYSTFIDNTLVAVLQLLRVDDLFKRLTPWLEESVAFLTRKTLPI